MVHKHPPSEHMQLSHTQQDPTQRPLQYLITVLIEHTCTTTANMIEYNIVHVRTLPVNTIISAELITGSEPEVNLHSEHSKFCKTDRQRKLTLTGKWSSLFEAIFYRTHCLNTRIKKLVRVTTRN